MTNRIELVVTERASFAGGQCCVATERLLVQEFLPEGSATVGFEVNIKHVSGAGEGTECSVWSRLDEVIEDRKFRFSVEVKDGDRVLGVGTHERRAISFNVA